MAYSEITFDIYYLLFISLLAKVAKNGNSQKGTRVHHVTGCTYAGLSPARYFSLICSFAHSAVSILAFNRGSRCSKVHDAEWLGGGTPAEEGVYIDKAANDR